MRRAWCSCAPCAGIKSPVEISAEILKALRVRAEAALGGELLGAVITVPAYFDDAQRQATKDAARLAGLNVLRLLNEPTAAAIAYGLDNGAEGIYAVYDLGGGTFDISILRLNRGVFEVLSTGGDSALGGDDFDHRMFCWIAGTGRAGAAVARGHAPADDRARARPRNTSADHGEARITARLATGEMVDCDAAAARTLPTCHRHAGAKTIAPVKKALRDAGLTVDDIKGVVMVGGATRMPQVQQAVAEFFGQAPLNNLDPDKVVALGAAIQANVLAGNRAAGDDWLLLDVIPLSLGLETMGGLVEKIIPRNSHHSDRPRAGIHHLQGRPDRDGDPRGAGRARTGSRLPLSGALRIARHSADGGGAARIRVTFQVDADGLLSVSAREQTSGVEAAVAVKPSYGLGDDEIARMLQGFGGARQGRRAGARPQRAAGRSRAHDRGRRSRRSQEDADLLERPNVAEITRSLELRGRSRAGDDRRAINDAMAAGSQSHRAFAARRMDRPSAAPWRARNWKT